MGVDADDDVESPGIIMVAGRRNMSSGEAPAEALVLVEVACDMGKGERERDGLYL